MLPRLAQTMPPTFFGQSNLSFINVRRQECRDRRVIRDPGRPHLPLIQQAMGVHIVNAYRTYEHVDDLTRIRNMPDLTPETVTETSHIERYRFNDVLIKSLTVSFIYLM